MILRIGYSVIFIKNYFQVKAFTMSDSIFIAIHSVM